MLLLTLIRHAKADMGELWQADHDRPLGSDGLQDAQATAGWWKQQLSMPDLYLVSSARRTQETAKILTPAQSKAELHLEPRLYEASPDMIWSILAEQDKQYGHIAVVAHNPALSQLVYSLFGDHVPIGLPPLGLVHCQLNASSWHDLSCVAEAKFMYRMTPEQLAESLI